MIGRKRSRRPCGSTRSGDRCSSRSAAIAKSTIMMPFFLTMPISRMMPISAIRLKSKPNSIRIASAPTPADGSVDRIVKRVDVALVENAEDQVDHDERREDQQRHACSSDCWNACAVPWKLVASVAGQCQIVHRPAAIASVAWPSATPWREVEADRHRRELALMADRQRAHRYRRPFARRPTAAPAAGQRRLDVELVERLELALQLRQDLQDHVIAVELGEILRRPGAGRTRRRACRRSAAAGCRSATPVAIDGQRQRRALGLLVGGDVAQLRQRSASWPRIFGAQSFSSSRLASCSVYSNCVRVARPPTRTSCEACR